MSKHRHNGKWISTEEMNKITLARQSGIDPQEEAEPETSVSEAPKANRKAIISELKDLGVEFKGNAKTQELEELLKSKIAEEPETSVSEQ